MKNVIQIIFLILVAGISQVQAQEVREQVLTAAEVEMGEMFFDRMINHPLSLGNGVSWLDAGRAHTESAEIVLDINDFKAILDQILGLKRSKPVDSFGKLPPTHNSQLTEAYEEIRLAIEALPSMEETTKSSLRTYLEIVLGKTKVPDGLNYIDFIQKLRVGMDVLEGKYTRTLPALSIRAHMFEVVKLEPIVMLAMSSALAEIVEKHGLTDVETESLLQDLSNYDEGFEEMSKQVKRKWGYHYYNIDVFEVFDRAFQFSIEKMCELMGYEHVVDVRPPNGRVDKEGFRRELPVEKSGEKLALTERMARLRTASLKMK